MNPLKIVFAGTPEFAARHLKHLLDSPHQVLAVYTQPDRPAGRGKKLSPSPVKSLALAHDLPVLQPASLKSTEAQEELAGIGADLMIVVAYGLLLPPEVLHIPVRGCLNVHASLLPRWRGAAPIQRAIEAGDRETGVTIMQMDAGLDTGDMLLISKCEIEADETSASLHDKLAEIGPPALLKTLDLLNAGELQAQKQDDTFACYAKKIDKAEAEINWRESATVIQRKIRAFNPFPIAYTLLQGERLKIHQADCGTDVSNTEPGTVILANRDRFQVACGEGSLLVQRLQLAGKKAMTPSEFANGCSQRCPAGTLLG